MGLANHQSPCGEEAGLTVVPLTPLKSTIGSFNLCDLKIVLRTTTPHHTNAPIILILQIRKLRFRERKKRLRFHSTLWFVF